MECFKTLKHLKTLRLHSCCDDELCLVIAQNMPNLMNIKIKSINVTDNGFEVFILLIYISKFILQHLKKLKYINIANSNRINGHCFEKIADTSYIRPIEIKVFIWGNKIMFKDIF